MQNELEAKQIGANELSKEDMGNASGGYIYKGNRKWNVIDDTTGEIRHMSRTKLGANAASFFPGQSGKELNSQELDNLKNSGHI